jgi:hypothetical protein
VRDHLAEFELGGHGAESFLRQRGWGRHTPDLLTGNSRVTGGETNAVIFPGVSASTMTP